MDIFSDQKVVEPNTHPGMLVTDESGVAKLQVFRGAGEVYIGGRRFGYVTPYGRITTSTEEYTPPVERSYWVKSVAEGSSDLEVQFELQPVPPLSITTRKRDGTPVSAKVLIFRHGRTDPYRMPELVTDEKGLATVAVRPALFDIDIVATTEDGLSGSLTVELSKDLTKPEQVTVIVE